jgi:hypothetical protein
LNIAIDICLRTTERVKKEIDNVDGRISVSKTEPKSSSVCLYLTKPDNVLPIIQINVDVADTESEKNEIAICIIGALREQEHDVPFTDISAKSIIDDYENLEPWVKEGIVHRIGQPDEPRKVASKHLEVKYRMHDEFYPEVDEIGHYDIDEIEIAKTLFPYIKSLHEIYSRIYPKVK